MANISGIDLYDISRFNVEHIPVLFTLVRRSCRDSAQRHVLYCLKTFDSEDQKRRLWRPPDSSERDKEISRNLIQCISFSKTMNAISSIILFEIND